MLSLAGHRSPVKRCADGPEGVGSSDCVAYCRADQPGPAFGVSVEVSDAAHGLGGMVGGGDG